MPRKLKWLIIFLAAAAAVALSIVRRSARVPAYGRAFLQQGLDCMDKCEPEETLGYFQQALYHDPGLADAYYQMGVMAGRRGDREGQIGLYERTVELDPSRFKLYLDITDYYFGKGELEYLTDFVWRTYDNPDGDRLKIYMDMARHYDGKSRYPEALFWYATLFMYDPTYSAGLERRIELLIFRVQGLREVLKRRAETFKAPNYLANKELQAKIDGMLNMETLWDRRHIR